MYSLDVLRKFVAPEFIFGCGALELSGVYARNLGARKVLVVTDQGVMDAGWTSRIIERLRNEHLDYSVFSEVTPNPRDFEVMKGADFLHQEKCDAILAVGGGSPIDCAKAIGIVTSNGGHILDYEGVDKVAKPVPPLICIPTTAGTGADVSQFSIIADTARKIKIAIISKAIVPDVSLIDPETTTTMSSELTACTGMDSLTHAFEAYVSNASSHMTDLLALDAIGIIVKNLHGAINEPLNLLYRSEMMMGCLEAGLAFSNASLGAVHAMAHSLGGLLDLPHGACNALLLEWVVDCNFASASGRYTDIGRAMGLQLDGPQPQALKEKIMEKLRKLRSEAGLSGTIALMGVRHDHVESLAENAVKDPCMVTNPRELTKTDIAGIYERAL